MYVLISLQRFSPSFRSDEMRHRLSDGDVDAPLLIYVGRIGAEKKLHRLKKGERHYLLMVSLNDYSKY